MSTRTTIIVVSIFVLAGTLLIYFYSKRDSSPRYNWAQSYRVNDDQPYGVMFIQKMLSSSHSGSTRVVTRESIHQVLTNKDYKNADYVLIGESVFLDADDIAALRKFLDEGNDVFIATMEPPRELLDSVYYNRCDTAFSYIDKYETSVTANFYNKNLKKRGGYKFNYRNGPDDREYYWYTVNPSSACSSSGFSELGYQNSDEVNFISIPYGSNNGHLYLHTVPLMFTNYFMTSTDKVEYASAVFSYLNGEDLIWDEVSKVPFTDTKKNPYDSPLYYIMQQPALKYAWWMLLIGALLYILFASKRTQRVIPVLETKTNTSLEFLNVISSLHFQNPDHLDIARKKMRYFLYFIRAKYGINTQAFTQDHVKRLADKSKVDIADVQAIHDSYKKIESYGHFNEEPDRLIVLYHAIEKFYKTCK